MRIYNTYSAVEHYGAPTLSLALQIDFAEYLCCFAALYFSSDTHSGASSVRSLSNVYGTVLPVQPIGEHAELRGLIDVHSRHSEFELIDHLVKVVLVVVVHECHPRVLQSFVLAELLKVHVMVVLPAVNNADAWLVLDQ